jgi:hypothetical protein
MLKTTTGGVEEGINLEEPLSLCGGFFHLHSVRQLPFTDIHATTLFVKSDRAINQRVKRPVFTDPNIIASVPLGSTLADDDRACADELIPKSFDTQSFTDAVTSVTNASLTFLMSHKLILFRKLISGFLCFEYLE